MTAPLHTSPSPASLSPRGVARGRRISAAALRRNARYSRWVGGLKLLLPAAAVAIVSLILAWPQLMIDDKRFNLNPAAVTTEDASSLRMLRPRFVGIDEKHRPFTVTADEASQAEPQTRKLLLVRPHADITMENSAWVTLSALSGVYQSDRRTLLLKERVDVFHDSGAEFHTDEALVDLAAGAVTGVMPVEGQGPAGTVTGQGIEVRDRGAVVIFTGRAKVVLWSRGNNS